MKGPSRSSCCYLKAHFVQEQKIWIRCRDSKHRPCRHTVMLQKTEIFILITIHAVYHHRLWFTIWKRTFCFVCTWYKFPSKTSLHHVVSPLTVSITTDIRQKVWKYHHDSHIGCCSSYPCLFLNAVGLGNGSPAPIRRLLCPPLHNVMQTSFSWPSVASSMQRRGL
jgi:hypothetical protein